MSHRGFMDDWLLLTLETGDYGNGIHTWSYDQILNHTLVCDPSRKG